MATKQSSRTKKKQKLLVRAGKRPAAKAKTTETTQPKIEAAAAHAPAAAEPQKTEAAPSTHRIASVWSLMRTAVAVLVRRRWLFLGIGAVYVVCNLLLVQTASATNVEDLKKSLGISTGPADSITAGLTLFTVLVAASGNGATQTGAAYQSVLVFIVSLAVVWALREVTAGRTIRIRDSFYRGMYPLIPVLLVLLMVFVHLIPLALGAGVFGIVVVNGIAVNNLQVALWSLLLLAGLALSAFFLISSLFALYIAALPDMTPMRALRSAKNLVRGRRWTVLRKLVFLPLALAVVGLVIMLPIIWWVTPAAAWIFFILSVGALLVVHSYMYALYRELLV